MSKIETKSPLEFIEMLRNQHINSDILSKIVDLIDYEMRIQNRQQMFSDLRNLQADLKNLSKNSRGHGGIRYTDLASWTANIRNHVAQHNFSIVCTEIFEPQTTLTTKMVKLMLIHANGEQLSVQCRFPCDSGRGKSEIQATGSTLTYARRYLLGMILNVATTDEDPDMCQNTTDAASDADKQKILALCAETKTDVNAMLKAIHAQSLGTLTDEQAKMALHGLNTKKNKNR